MCQKLLFFLYLELSSLVKNAINVLQALKASPFNLELALLVKVGWF